MKPATIDDYISAYPVEVKEKLLELKKLVHEEVPDVSESISYGVPTFKKNGTYIVYFAAYKSHIAMYPINFDIEKELPEMAEYRTGKGTAQFPLDKPLPFPLIRKAVKILAEKNLERKGKK